MGRICIGKSSVLAQIRRSYRNYLEELDTENAQHSLLETLGMPALSPLSRKDNSVTFNEYQLISSCHHIYLPILIPTNLRHQFCNFIGILG